MFKKLLKNREACFCLFSAIGAIGLAAAGLRASDALSAAKDADKPSLILPASVTNEDIIGEGRTVAGREDAPTTLVMWGDYQCPPCRRAHDEAGRLKVVRQGQMRVIFRNFPLKRHLFARAAAVAAESASSPAAFVKIHQQFFERGDTLTTSSIEALSLVKDRPSAQKVGETRVNEDVNFAQSVGIDATPTLILCSEKPAPPRVVTLSQLATEPSVR